MKKFVTNTPENGVEALLNRVYVKDNEVWLRELGEECEDISLVNFTRKMYKHEYGHELPEEISAEQFGEYMDHAGYTEAFYFLAVGFAEVREKLKRYEELNIEEVLARNIAAWETSKDKREGLLPEVYLTDRCLFRKLTGLEPIWRNLQKFAPGLGDRVTI